MATQKGLPRDEFGHPYQPLFWFDDTRPIGLVRDEEGHVLPIPTTGRGDPGSVNPSWPHCDGPSWPAPASKIPPSVNMRREHRSTATSVGLGHRHGVAGCGPTRHGDKRLAAAGRSGRPQRESAWRGSAPCGAGRDRRGARRARDGSSRSLTRSRLHRGARTDYRSGDKCLASSVRLADRHRDSGAGNEGAGTRRSEGSAPLCLRRLADGGCGRVACRSRTVCRLAD